VPVLYTNVAFYADLTPYSYGCGDGQPYSPGRDEPWADLPVVNIGWLDTIQPFRTGSVPDGMFARLEDLAKLRARQSHGYHYCELCIRDLGGEPFLRDLGAADRNYVMETLPHESAEFRVKGCGVVYAVPQLALHYIEAHSYLPPDEFCDAVMACTPEPS
jgi:hypothetical protein